MSARVAVFQEQCPGRVPIKGRHYFERVSVAREDSVVKGRRMICLRCSYCRSTLTVETTNDRKWP